MTQSGAMLTAWVHRVPRSCQICACWAASPARAANARTHVTPSATAHARRSIAAGLALVLVMLVLVGLAVVQIAGGLVRVAARAARMSP